MRQWQCTSYTDVMQPSPAAARGGGGGGGGGVACAAHSVDAGTDAAAGRNVWLERREFYNSAVPRDHNEEEEMLRAALELSKLEHVKSTRSSVLALHCRCFCYCYCLCLFI